MSLPPAFHALLAAARDGEDQALAEVYRQFYPRVRGMVHQSLSRRLRGSKPWLIPILSTRDLVQDVFHRTLRDLDAFEGSDENAFVAYLAAAVRNRLVDSVRFHEAVRRDRRRHDAADAADCVSSARDAPWAIAASAEELRRFSDALDHLSARERMLVRERLESESSYPELATLLGYPSADAARKAFHKAQARLLAKLRRDGMGTGET